MSKDLEKLLTRLRDFGDAKLAELESLRQEHITWLRAAVQDMSEHTARPAAKKQKVEEGSVDVTKKVFEESEVREEAAMQTMRWLQVVVGTQKLPKTHLLADNLPAGAGGG
jgi:hypothetical protein